MQGNSHGRIAESCDLETEFGVLVAAVVILSVESKYVGQLACSHNSFSKLGLWGPALASTSPALPASSQFPLGLQGLGHVNLGNLLISKAPARIPEGIGAECLHKIESE